MQKELTKLRRRPLYVPLIAPFLLMGLVIVAPIWFFDARSTTVVVALRRAEAEAGDDPDRALSDAGRERAQRLARMLSQMQPVRAVDAIYASDLRRTQQTVTPLAETMGLPVNVRPLDAWARLPRLIRDQHRGQVVVVAGHSNTLPPLIEALTGEQVTIAEDEYGDLFILFVPRFSEPRLLRLKY
ncbi:MAG TPA: phosphoglycerate mutase family protein [Steroidobacteraceae bacterium]|nr:phosphoglycerate mutase family protein [Steroidobacteraceae bacterium]